MPRLAAFALLLLVPALIWGPAELTGRIATAKAKALGPYCWAVRNPAGYSPDLILTLDPRAPYRFWSNEKDTRFEETRPHFAIVRPEAPYDAYALGWSFGMMDFWQMDSYRAQFHGLAFAQESCRNLLASARS